MADPTLLLHRHSPAARPPQEQPTPLGNHSPGRRRPLPPLATPPAALLTTENGHLPTSSPDFDRIARPYRWLEYLTLGRALERCRLHFLPQLADREHALVLGDGDGRFLAALLAQNCTLTADAVDISAAMLNLLRTRCEQAAPNASSRLRTHQTDALSFTASAPNTYDLVVTHFFLDCLTQPEIETLAGSIANKFSPGALWLISDFRIPSGLARLPAKLLVRALYLAFRILTGLRTKCLPNYAAALTGVGFTRIAQFHSLFGILVAELWAAPSGTP